MKIPAVDIGACTLCEGCIEVCPSVFFLNNMGYIEVAVLSEYPESEVDEAIKSQLVTGGMIPKVSCCRDVVKSGVPKAHIIDGRLEHAVLLELFTKKGIGTEIVA